MKITVIVILGKKCSFTDEELVKAVRSEQRVEHSITYII